MKIVDIFLAAPKVEARGVIAELLGVHGFKARWRTPWTVQADRGSSFGHLFSPTNPYAAKCTFSAQVLDNGVDACVVRLERRYIPTGEHQAALSLFLADEFENLCDEVSLAFSADGRVEQVVVYGAPPLVVVDARTAKPPPPILPAGHLVAAAHASPTGPPWTPAGGGAGWADGGPWASADDGAASDGADLALDPAGADRARWAGGVSDSGVGLDPVGVDRDGTPGRVGRPDAFAGDQVGLGPGEVRGSEANPTELDPDDSDDSDENPGWSELDPGDDQSSRAGRVEADPDGFRSAGDDPPPVVAAPRRYPPPPPLRTPPHH